MAVLALACWIFSGLAVLTLLGADTRRSTLPHRVITFTLALTLGAALASATTWLQIRFGHWIFASASEVLALDASVAAVLTAVAFILRRRRREAGSPIIEQPRGSAAPRWLIVAFGVALVASCVSFLALASVHAAGGWDAVMTWTARARGLSRAGPDLFAVVFGSHAFHPDYPLFVPGLVARLWRLAGTESLAIPVAVASALVFATAGLLVAAVRLLRDGTSACVVGLLLLGCRVYVREGPRACADLPLGFWILAAFVALALGDRNGIPGYSVLAGACVGVAMWTKNEGTVAAVLILCARIAAVASARDPGRSAAREAARLLVGVLPWIVLLADFKHRVAQPNDMTAGLSVEVVMSRLLDWKRWSVVIPNIARRWLETGGLTLIALPMLWLFLGFGRRDASKIAMRTLCLGLGGLLVAWVGMFLLTPHDFAVQSERASYRLFLQLWPALLLFVGVVVRERPQGERLVQPTVALEARAAAEGGLAVREGNGA